MQDLTVRIVEARDMTAFDRRTGATRAITFTSYMLGDLGPFVVEIPSAEYSEAKLREAIEEKARALRPFA